MALSNNDTAETTFFTTCLSSTNVFELTASDSIPKTKSDTITITLS